MSIRKLGFLLLLILVLSISIGPIQAQNQDTILTLAVPDFFREFFEDEVIAEFEATHPGIQLEIVSESGFGLPFYSGGDIGDYLDTIDDYVSNADVIVVNDNLLPEATRAGYFLDLAPLVSTDSTLNSADFYTAMWNSFQWDGGIWGLPAAGDAILLFYDPELFDAVGLAYPDENWTISDLEFAIRSLTQVDANGTTTSPGLLNFDDSGALFVNLLGEGVYDDSVIPSVPRYNNAELESILTTWASIEADGLLNLPDTFTFGLGFDGAPMLFAPSNFGAGASEGTVREAVLLGRRGAVTANGFGISSGTQNPEAAYELVKFLINNELVSNLFFGNRPANRNIEYGGPFAGITIDTGTAEQMEPLIATALENGIPLSERLFADRLGSVVSKMVQNNLDARSALQAMESEILAQLDAASAHRGTVQVTVNSPDSAQELAPGEIALNFGIASVITPLPDMDRWEAAAQDFADSDPQVGYVSLDTMFPFEPIADMAESYDCFVTPSNVIPSVDLSILRSIDPLIASDPNFTPDDFVANVLASVSRDNQLWALPLSLQPVAMRYVPDDFANAGVLEPFNGWTVSDFEAALRSFSLGPDSKPPFETRAFSNSDLLLLIAAYGGLPVDYQTTPPTINFTDPVTVEAIRQVLDLARDGFMSYEKLTSTGDVVITTGGEPSTIYIDTLSAFGMGGNAVFIVSGGGGGGGGSAPSGGDTTETRLVSFPRGTQYAPISYQLQVGYISATTQAAEACYRFLSFISERTELYQAMPARRSIIDHPDLAATQGAETIEFFQSFDAMAQDPNAIVIDSSGLGADQSDLIGRSAISYWLNRAFDRYVLEDADLETELADAELFTKAFLDCAADIEIPQGDNTADLAEQLRTCAVQVDPTAQIFGS